VLKKFTLVSLIALLAIAAMPALAGGPVYDELPDLGGQEIIIGVENLYTPFQFNDPRLPDQAIGFEYDVVNEICRRINCTPVYEVTSFDAQLTGAQDGTYDMVMNGLFIFPDREEIYDFSIPYLESGTYLLGRTDEDRFNSIDEFIEKAEAEDLRFGVQANSFGQEIATSIHPVPESQVVSYDDFNVMLVALINGDIDTMVVDAFAGRYVGVNSESFKLIGDRLVDPLPTALMFEKGSEFVAPFNAALESMQRDGYLNYLLYKWSVDFQVFSE
jgi:polar amino acid transport system substrate-binding protein